MDNVQKFIDKLNIREARKVYAAITAIRSGNLTNLDVKKLQGFSNVYRVRVGGVRILFAKLNGLNIVTEVGFRSDNTY